MGLAPRVVHDDLGGRLAWWADALAGAGVRVWVVAAFAPAYIDGHRPDRSEHEEVEEDDEST